MKRAVSIIVPAYNEEKRIGNFLRDLLKFAKSRLKNYEIIVVDDGSTDNTAEIIRKAMNKNRNARLISYKPNRGKGFAVRRGVFAAEGDLILFIDSDGSISPEQILNMMQKLREYEVVVGDRGSEKSEVKQAKSRKIIGTIFNFYVSIIFKTNVRDNLCGFKGFHRDIAHDIFKNLVAERWLFDVELFYKIKKKKYKLYNLPIRWVHKEGSKIRLIDPFKMLFQLIVLRIRLIGS